MVARVGPRYHPRMVRLLPQSVRSSASCRQVGCLLLVVVVLVAGGVPRSDAQEAASPERPVTIRVTWGGGKARAWSGLIRLVPAEGEPPG